MSKTDKQIVDDANELARALYMSQGYDVKPGYRFDRAFHPQERGCWNMAALAYNFIEGTDIKSALANVEE